MTVALYISPKSLMAPFIITDTLISDQNGKPLSAIASRVRNVQLGQSYTMGVLARKSCLFGTATAVAFAGELKTIKDFIDYAPMTIGSEEDERPLKALAQRASEYRRGSINVISILVLKGLNRLTKVKPDYVNEIEIDNLGFVSAIGSGSNDLIERLKLYHKPMGLMEMNEETRDVASAYKLAEVLCMDVIVREVYFEGQREYREETDWGAVLEYVYYDRNDWCWKRKPRTAYFIFQSFRNDDGTLTAPQFIDRQFVYEPGNHEGWFMAIRRSADGSYNASYKLSSIATPDPLSVAYDWTDWYPEYIGVALVAGTFDGDSMNDIKFAINGYAVDEFNGVEVVSHGIGPSFKPFGENLETFLISAKKDLARQYHERL